MRAINQQGRDYTVDEASAALGVPRPTLYRYLKEYSIPYARRSGRISIPEDSLDLIRTVRRLRDEGLGAEAVRRQLREGPGLDRLAERLDRVSGTLEDLRGTSKPSSETSASQALRIIIARQTLLISAVSNLTEMVEDLRAASGLVRRSDPGGLEAADIPLAQHPVPLDPEGIHEEEPTAEVSPWPDEGASRRPAFGALARRRRVGLVVCAALVIAALAWAVLAFGGA